MVDTCNKKYIFHKDIPFIELNNSCNKQEHELNCDLCNIYKKSHIGSGGYNSTFIIQTKDCSSRNCNKLRNHSGVLRLTHKYLDYEEMENEKNGLYLQSLFSTSKKKGGYGCSKYICKVYDFGYYSVKNKDLAKNVFNCQDEKSSCKPIKFDFDTGIYGILENISGGELFERLVYKVKRKNPYTEIEVSEIIRQLLSGLHCMHSKGYVHFDIKLENILLKNKISDTDIKIIDFGFVNKIPYGKEYINPNSFGRAGTPSYKAPEVNFSFECNQKSDIWSVGIVCIALLLERTNYEDVSRDPDSFTETLLPDRFFAKNDYELNNLPCGEPLSKEGFDFLKKVLVWDKESRLDTNACLKHPWIYKKFNK